MKILVRADSLNEFDNSVNCLLVEIDEDVKKEILARRELLQMVRSRDKQVLSMSFWGIPGDFYDEAFDELLGENEMTFDSKQILVMDDDFVIEHEREEDGPVRTELDQMVITENGFYFTAGLKYGSSWVESRELSYELLLHA